MKEKIYLLVVLVVVRNVSASYFTAIEKCKLSSMGKEYVGNVSTSENGIDCLKWTKETFNQLNLPEINQINLDSILDTNYCRNPTNFPNGPWCIVDYDTLEWEYCDIPLCHKDRNWCKDTSSGIEYIGKMKVTKSGKTCKPWTNQNKFVDKSFPENSRRLAANNCRNPLNSSSGPWCYVDDQYSIMEECDIPKCDEKLEQEEYFGGYDYLKMIKDHFKVVTMGDVFQKVSFSVSFKSELWTPDVSRKSALWATDYSLECQKNFDTYEYCEPLKSETNGEITITYNCISPLRSVIFISPLKQNSYNIQYQFGKLFQIHNKAGEGVLNYEEKMKKYLTQRKKKDLIIPVSPNHGHLLLIDSNVIPYAVTPGNKVVFAISEIGNGRIGFAASEKYLDENFQSYLQDFSHVVYGKDKVAPEQLTENVLNIMDSERTRGQSFIRPVIWNAHNEIGISAVKLLISLVKDGLRIIIGIKPWAYHHYIARLLGSEIKLVFLAAGIWPSMAYLSENITVLNRIETQTFPLVHLLDYAAINLENAIQVSDIITNAMVEIPWEDLLEERKFEAIKEKIRILFEIHLHQIKNIIPCLKRPVLDNKDKKLIGLINSLLIQPLGNRFIAPGVSFYPGIIYSSYIKYVDVEMRLNLKFNDEAAQLGLYMSPGKDVSVKVKKSTSETCTLYVNFHLFNIFKKAEWEKWPITQTSIIIERNRLKTFSFAFGGLLSLSCKENDDKVDIILTGVIQVPMYDRRDNGLNRQWNKMQRINTPWSVISSDTVTFIVPSIAIRNLAKPNYILELYDLMVKEELHLRGKTVSGSKRDIVSTDIQIKLGYMHSGYPIGTQIVYVTNPSVKADFLFNPTNVKKEGRWGVLHEVGHNLQDPLFTFTGSGDVTNNVFTLVAVETMTGKDYWSPEGWLFTEKINLDDVISYLKNGTFADWKSRPFLGLCVYVQIKHNFGWELFSQIFRRYDVLKSRRSSFTDDMKIQEWIKETSTYAKMNLCPLYDLWRWPIWNKTNTELSKFPYFLPDDFLTQRVETRLNEIIDKYGGPDSIMRKPIKVPVIVGRLRNKSTIEGSKIIEETIILDEPGEDL